MPKPVLSICLVSFNTRDITLQTLDSILNSLQKSKLSTQSVEIIIVDNHSTDDSVGAIKKFIRLANKTRSNIQMKLVESEANTGFAAGNNLAINQSTGQYILLLNSDVLIEMDALGQLLTTYQALEKEGSNIQLLAPQLLNKDGSIQSQGGDLPNLLTLKTHMLMLAKLPGIGRFLPSVQNPYQQLVQIGDPPLLLQSRGWTGGTAMMFARKTYQIIGPLNEQIFMYGEDTEYCLRAQRKGISSAIDPQAEIIHLGSQSSSPAHALIGELSSLLLIFYLHLPAWQLRPAYWLLKAGVALRLVVFGWFKFNSNKAKAYKQAWRELKVVYNRLQA